MNLRSRGSVLCIAVVLFAGVAREVTAQQAVTRDSIARPFRKNCWRGRPKPACDAFLLTEFGFFRSVVNPTATYTSTYSYDGEPQTYTYELHPSEWKFSAEVGGMVNRGNRAAIGGTVLLDVSGDGASIGAKARYRRWLTPEGIALDFGAGFRTTRDEILNDVVYPPTGSYTYRGPRHSVGFTGDVAINAMDYVSVVTRVDVSHYDKRLQPTISLGVRAESRPALFAFGGVVVTYTALALLFLSVVDDWN